MAGWSYRLSIIVTLGKAIPLLTNRTVDKSSRTISTDLMLPADIAQHSDCGRQVLLLLDLQAPAGPNGGQIDNWDRLGSVTVDTVE